jgi:autotransporter family porin
MGLLLHYRPIGANPTSIFAFEHGGSTGIASVQVPNLLVLGNATFSGIIYDNNGHAGIAGQVLTSTSSGVVWAAGGGGGGAVTSVSNVDGTLTIAPTTGAVVAGLALGHANSWTVLQTFSSVHLIGTLADSTGAVGTSGQVLESTVSGTLWTTPPSFSNSFSALTSGTNTIAAMVVGSGATLGTSGTGTITANTLSATVTMPASTVFAPTSGSTLSITGPANTKLLDNTGDYILLSGGVTLADSSGFDSIELNSTSHAITFTSPNEFNFEGGGTIGLPNGSTAATQNPGDTSTLVATDAFVAAAITAAGHAFSGITSGTNTTAAMLVGSGATLSSSGTGTVTANTLASTVTVPATTTLVPASGSSIALYVTGSNSIGMGSSSGSNQIIFTNIGTTTLEASSQLLLDAPVINAQGQLNTYAVLMDGHVGALLVDVVGTVTISASTSASVTFTSAFGAAPCVVVTPTSDTTAVGAYWVTTSTTGFTVHVHTSGTVTFQYFVIGNGGV